MAISATVESTSTVSEEVTPYQVISMLLDGALERVDQAISSLDEGDIDEAAVLVQKTIGIVGGLRDSLNIEEGGAIASNLDALYDYIVNKLNAIGKEESPLSVLYEVKTLLAEVHEGWTGISEQVN